jgi:hypothetical protein
MDLRLDHSLDHMSFGFHAPATVFFQTWRITWDELGDSADFLTRCLPSRYTESGVTIDSIGLISRFVCVSCRISFIELPQSSGQEACCSSVAVLITSEGD